MSIYDIRRENLRLLFDRHGGRKPRDGGKLNVAVALGYTNASYLSQMAGSNPTKVISENVARSIEAKLGLPPGVMDLPALGEHAPPSAPEAAKPPAGAPPARLREQILVDATRAVLDAARTAGRALSSDQIAEIIALVYHAAATTGAADTYLAQRLVALMAR